MNAIKKIIVLLIVTHSLTYAQKKYELGKVTVEELNEKSHPKDTSAVAAILFEKGEERYDLSDDAGFQIIRNVKLKIKIYKKEGYEFANKSVDYFMFSSARQKVDFSNVATYNLVDGKVEKTKLKSNGEFDEKVSKYLSRKKITLPNVKEGSIIEIEYTLTSPYDRYIAKWYFQSSIPVNYSEYTTYIPEFYVYKTNMNGFFTPKKTEEVLNRSHTSSYLSKSWMSSSSSTKSTFDYKEIKTNYIFQDLPAFKDEMYVNNIRNYLASVDNEISMVRFPNTQPKSYATDWELVTKTIYENESFGNELNKTGYFEEDVTALISGLKSNEEKVVAIFNFVKSKVKWNDYTSFYCDEGVKTAYKNGTGNSAEINLMLTAMLRFAGIEANPILVSTRSHGISYFPSRDAYNYVISGIEVQNDVILLDATDPYTLPNILPIRGLNWNGRIIRKNGSSASVDLMPKKASSEVIYLMATIAADGNLEGKIRDQYFDYNAYVYRDQYAASKEESYLEFLEKKYDNIEIDAYTATGKNDLGAPVVENYSFKTSNGVEIIGDKMFFSPLFFFATDENPFKQEKREYPIDFVYPSQDRYIINITIPDGYAVESLPTSISIPMSDNLFNAKYIISAADNKIQLSYTKDTNTSIISSEYYEELKAVYTEIIKKENVKIVLKKI